VHNFYIINSLQELISQNLSKKPPASFIFPIFTICLYLSLAPRAEPAEAHPPTLKLRRILCPLLSTGKAHGFLQRRVKNT